MKFLLSMCAALAVLTSGACEPAVEGLVVSDAVYRGPLGTSDIGVAYLSLTSSKDDRIIGVTSESAASVEMHETVTEDGRSRMRRVEAVDLPAGRDVVFASGGLHLMIISPEAPVAQSGEANATFPIQFQLESGHTQIVRFLAGTGPAHPE